MADFSSIDVLGQIVKCKDSVARTTAARGLEVAQAAKTQADKIAALQRDYNLTGITVYEIGVGKTYANPIAAFAAADKTQPALFLLYEGQYDVSSAPELGLRLYDNWFMLGVGTAINCHLYYNATTAQQYRSVLNMGENCGIDNVYLSGSNIRYVIHDDFDEGFKLFRKRFVTNCIIEGSNLVLQYPYGAGMKGGCRIDFSDNLVINATGDVCVSWHNMTGAITEDYINICNNTFISKGKNTIRLSAVMAPYEDRHETHNVKVNAFNNTRQDFIFDLEYGSGNPYELFCNGTHCHFWAANNQIINFSAINNPDMFIKIYPFESNYPVGTPMFVSDQYLAAYPTNQPSPGLVEGVLLQTGTTTQNVNILKAGGVQASLLGLSGNSGQWLNYKAGAPPTITVSNERNFNTIGYLDNSGLAVIDIHLR